MYCRKKHKLPVAAGSFLSDAQVLLVPCQDKIEDKDRDPPVPHARPASFWTADRAFVRSESWDMLCKLPTIGIAFANLTMTQSTSVYFRRLLELVLIRCGPATYAPTVCGMSTKRLGLGIVMIGSCITQC